MLLQFRTTDRQPLPPPPLPIRPSVHTAIDVNRAVSRSPLQQLTFGTSACRAALGAWQACEPKVSHWKRERDRAPLIATSYARLRMRSGVWCGWCDATVNTSIAREVGWIQYDRKLYISWLCLHEENCRGGTEVSVKITCDVEEKEINV